MTRCFTFHMPSQVRFCCGLFRRLATLAFPGSRALIVTGGNAIHTYGLLSLLQSQLQEKHISAIVWDKARQLVSLPSVAEAAALARSENCDFIIALGGGSCMNAGRAVAFMVPQEGELLSYTQEGGRHPSASPCPSSASRRRRRGCRFCP